MKHFILIFAFILFASIAPHAFAATNIGGFVPLAPISGLTDPGALSVVNSSGLASFFNNLYKFCIGLAAGLAVVMIIWGGLQISTQDSISKQGEGKEKIQNAILGLVLVLSPVLVFSIINPNILNLSLNLPPIDLKPGTGGGVGACPKDSQGTPPNCTCILPMVGTPPNCSIACGGGGRRIVGGKCIQPPPQDSGPQYYRPAKYWCYELIPFIPATKDCGADDTGGALSCNYMCSADPAYCNKLLADEMPLKGSGKNIVVGTSCTQTP